jgi:hypothetical protein
MMMVVGWWQEVVEAIVLSEVQETVRTHSEAINLIQPNSAQINPSQTNSTQFIQCLPQSASQWVAWSGCGARMGELPHLAAVKKQRQWVEPASKELWHLHTEMP